MSVANKLLQAAAGNAGSDPVYVDDVFSTTLYTGVSKSSGYTDINTGVDCNTDGGMVWIKQRSGNSTNHGIWDTERTNGYYLPISTDNGGNIAQASASTPFIRTTGIRFSAYGGTVNHGWFNDANEDHVVWSFKKQEKFFDIVTYTGNATNGRTVSHNLGSVPGMILVKRTSSSGYDWQVYHRGNTANPETDYLSLNTQDGTKDNDSRWNDTAPTSTEFTLGNSSYVNGSGASYVAYLFAHDEQEFGEDSDEAIIKCGSYVGNGTSSSSTQHIDLGFEPQFFLVKVAHNSIEGPVNGQSWFLLDTMRGFANNGNDSNDVRLMPDDTSAEFGVQVGHPTPTGIQINGNEPEVNTNNNTYVYLAIARPHKPASEFAATDLFAIDTKGGTSPTPPAYVSGFPVDMALHQNVASAGDWRAQTRLTQGTYLETNNTGSQVTDGNMAAFDYQNGYRNATGTTSTSYAWMFRRAKGYFDVVTYTGTGANRTVSHNLGVAPELMIIKDRDGTNHWAIYNSTSGATKYMHFNTSVPTTNSTYFNDTEPTSSVFTVGTQSRTNRNTGNFVAYLFASVDGISKIGSFTKVSGTDFDVDCGFSSGAKLVIIKRTDSTSPWYLFNSDRGINAGNDPYIALNSNAAEVTNADIIDPLSSGFTATSGLTAGDYIFLAIA